jgi:hypothetical protein
MAMTATGGITPRLTIGECWTRAAAVFLDPRFSDHAPLTLDSDYETPQREFPLG